MSIFTFGIPDQASFEANSSPYLESVENLTKSSAGCFGARCVHHGIIELLLVEKGVCRLITMDKKALLLQKGSLVLIGSGVLHYFKRGENLHALVIRIGGVHLRGLPPAQLTTQEVPVFLTLDSAPDKSTLLTLLQSIKLLSLQQNASCRCEVGASLAQAVIVMLASLAQKRANASAENALRGIGNRIKEYIDAHYLEDLKLPEIAAALHINPFYLAHTFKALTGSSPMAYITRRRIDEAQNLLLTTNLTVTAIAMECGYNNSNYFQSVFKNIVGMPPGKYRKIWKQDS